MEPMEINGGRFYARPLHDDDRIDDTPALALISTGLTPLSVPELRAAWHEETMLSWAICEQTNVEMIGLAILHIGENKNVLDIVPVGDPRRVLPNDPVLEPKTVGDVIEIRGALIRWAQAMGYDIADNADNAD
ncbi:hypothetical protein EML15_05440 [Corynebacterium sp. sy017]|uniref:hypothetical protein n=1 Tax=unclassified Corynebacterium TaxID=2624378 RepID=UPI0011864578|nr:MULTISPECIES: hypothetical protein [unclassified Corynebacterium]MBP3088590.1 hypothetical protein [Corynebacterium sp. sy017]QDZ41999.1 hypothetical protein FQV43_01560 [Corynebacterium sp. sy039]TSD91884.1 hypothetical protein ELY17_05440 [Corynebacterium sp. SY003]